MKYTRRAKILPGNVGIQIMYCLYKKKSAPYQGGYYKSQSGPNRGES